MLDPDRRVLIEGSNPVLTEDELFVRIWANTVVTDDARAWLRRAARIRAPVAAWDHAEIRRVA